MSDYKKDLVIDKQNLDVEWEQQALLFADWSEKAVDAEFDRDKKKERLELIEAKVDSRIRDDDAKRSEKSKDYKKLTNPAIRALILQDKEYKEANTDYIEAVRQAKIYNVAVGAIDRHRKKALEKLTDLHNSGYWARPNIPAEKRREFDSEGTRIVREQLSRSQSERKRR